MTHFDKALLPPANSFYHSELGQLPRPDRHGWCRTNCPFHKSKSKKSFSVNVSHGGFYCFGCGAKGGDPVAFLMQRDKLTFRRACEALGAWKDLSAGDHQRIEEEKRDREQKRICPRKFRHRQKSGRGSRRAITCIPSNVCSAKLQRNCAN